MVTKNVKTKKIKYSKKQHTSKVTNFKISSLIERMKISIYKNRWTWFVVSGLFILVIVVVIIGTILNNNFPN
ncbi:hypothetical protein ASO20_01065 [Mycoplasma sp. (ex Biomphalaria glabrata)]|nr:hypothetical protein ASO20_01065 [Mycoplasma sp. (ex Biomphalaria glabrata)]